MDRRTYLKTSLAFGGSLLVPAGVLALAGCSGTSRTTEVARFGGNSMGTGYSVLLGAEPDATQINGVAVAELAERVRAALDDVDTHMSTWRTDSELSRFNLSDTSDWQPVSPATSGVIAKALQTSAATAGAFDATIGPLVDLWGFGAGSTDANSVPGASEIHRQLALVGYQSIEVDVERAALRKLNTRSRLDLSGIAKGHAVDRVAAVLDQHGVNSYLVEVGGELAARGRKPNGNSWKVAIERPSVGRREAFRALALDDRAIATSGDYRNFFADGGQRYSHSIDPRSGKPIDHELASVSVVADSTVAADALSTALIILGPQDAMAYAERHGVAAHLILKSGTSLKEVYSSAFEPLLA